MTNMKRIWIHPILGEIKKVEWIKIKFNGKELKALKGEPIAVAIMANNIKTLRRTRKYYEPRGIFCAIGRCTDCIMQVDGIPNIRTCITPAKDGMEIVPSFKE